MHAIVFFITLLTATAPSPELELRALDKQLVVATYTNDAQWFEQNLTDDYVLTTSTGRMITRADLLAQVHGGYKMEAYEPQDVVVRVYGDTAIITGRIVQKYVAGDQKVEADLRYTDVWMKRGNAWKNVIGHASAISVKKEKA